MEILKVSFAVLLGIGAVLILVFALTSGKPFKVILLNALLGIAALTVVNITTWFTGVHIPLNEWTATGCAVFGMPAVCGFITLQIIFK